jgi:hypothetical protein
VADLVVAVAEIRDFLARAVTPPANRSAASASLRTGPAMVRAMSIDSTIMTTAATGTRARSPALGVQDLLDVAALGGSEQQHPEHAAEALDRHRHGDDHHLAALVERTMLAGAPSAPALDFRIAACPFRSGRDPVDREIAADRAGQRGPRIPGFSTKGRPSARRGRQVEAQDVAAAVEVAAVEQQHAVAVVDARARLGRRDQPPAAPARRARD